MRTRKLIKKLEKAFKRHGLAGLLKLAQKDKIREAVEKAVEKHKKKIAKLE